MYLAALLSCALAACHKHDTLPEEMLVLRSQAAVYKVLAIGDVQVTYPKGVATRKSADQSEPPWRRQHYYSLVDREFQRDRHDGVIESSKNETEYCWEEVTEHPEKYLQASSEQTTESWTGQYASGSAFGVSREGILLTNAHVVSDPPSGELLNPDNIDSVIAILGQPGGPIAKMLDALAGEFGGQLPAQWPDYRKRQAVANLARWFAGQSNAKATFKRAQVVLKFDSWGSGEFIQGLLKMKPEILSAILKHPTTLPAKVLEPKGQTIPGKDVAILKLDRGDPALNEDLKDKLICLPLGDSDQVVPGTLIRAMGFPAIAFDAQLMDAEAAYRVSSPGGSIGPKKPMLGGGWEAFEMDAPINHGDSGGPVIDRSGDVIGLNVGAPNGISSGHNLAVPINLAKEFLRQAAINPDLGPLTQLWVDGLNLYARERYAEAQGKFVEVSRMQEGPGAALLSVDKGLAHGITNPYVQEMILRCRDKLRKKTANPS
jgi:S1-C subfamily serine protease